MDQYYCKICHKNIEIKKGDILRCPNCGYFLISSKLDPKEIIKRKIKHTVYCSHCEKIVLSISVKNLIDALTQRSTWEINNLRNNQTIREGQKLSERERNKIIHNISVKLKSAINYLSQIEKTNQYVCSQCYKEVRLHESTSPRLAILNCHFCNNQIDNDSTFCKHCGAKINGKTRHITKEIKKKVWHRDNGRCAICGSSEDLQFDHIIPYSKGGANSIDNLQILCSRCNKKKFNKISG